MKVSLHIGMNEVSPEYYSGWSGVLRACINDAHSMAEIAAGCNYSKIHILENAQKALVVEEIKKAHQILYAGDLFMLTYSGHGTQVPDSNGDERDMMDEAWCLHDGLLLDDELNKLFCGFRAGVQIIVTSDSCHSGTITRAALFPTMSMPPIKSMPVMISFKTFIQNRKDFPPKGTLNETLNKATSVITLSGCQDDQFSYDGAKNGVFTEALLHTYPNVDNYNELMQGIRKAIPRSYNQTPRLGYRHMNVKHLAQYRPYNHPK